MHVEAKSLELILHEIKALLARYDVTPPICVRFIGRVQNKMLDTYIEKTAASR